MSDAAVVLSDPAADLERAADPGEFVVLCCERGKAWLAEALAHGDLDALKNIKGYAEVLRVATVQKQLGKDAELTAQELVRRAERAIGQGIRAEQAAGRLSDQGRNRGDPPVSIGDVIPYHEWRGGGKGVGVKELTDDVSDMQFEAAVEEAKAERNLSRANVVRKVRDRVDTVKSNNPELVDRRAITERMAAEGNTSRQIADALGVRLPAFKLWLNRHAPDLQIPADAVLGRSRLIDSNRVMASVVTDLEGSAMSLDLIEIAQLDESRIEEWVDSFSKSISSLTTFRNSLRNKLKEQAQ